MEAAQYAVSIPETIPTFRYNPIEEPTIFDTIGNFFKGGSKSSSNDSRSVTDTVVGVPTIVPTSEMAVSPMLAEHGGMASIGAVTAPMGSGLSDYEFALQLQRQYDAEYHRK